MMMNKLKQIFLRKPVIGARYDAYSHLRAEAAQIAAEVEKQKEPNGGE